MKAALHKVRLEYQQDYEKFILKIETESDEVGSDTHSNKGRVRNTVLDYAVL